MSKSKKEHKTITVNIPVLLPANNTLTDADIISNIKVGSKKPKQIEVLGIYEPDLNNE